MVAATNGGVAMKLGVMGAGAVGCYYGGMLARAGNEVVLIGRPAHVEAVKRAGLLLETTSFTERVPMQASSEAASLAGCDLVLCCVKSTDTAKAAAEMGPYLGADTIVLSLQNGVDNAQRLQELLGLPVIPAVVYVATEMAGPGHVKHNGRGELVIGPSPASDAVVRVFAGAGVQITVSEDVIAALWAKLVLNCAYNALSAITQVPYGRLVQGAGVWGVMRDVVAECLAVARADGVALPDDVWASIERITATMPGQYSSTAQDLARGKPSEIDHLNGYVMRRGEALGIPTPVNRTLHALVRVLQDNRRGPARP